MERPEHFVTHSVTNSQVGARRFSGIIIVGAIHAGIAILLILGMVTKMELKKEDLQATVEQQKVQPKAPPPPPPKFEKPPPPFVPPPEFNIQNEAPPPRAIVTTSVPPPAPPPPAPPRVAAPPPVPPAPAEAITATHTKPPYPPLSQRLGEHGVTLLNVSIDENGRCTDATVVTSSGSKRLDEAAIDYVKQRYRWKPATRDGKPVSTTQPLRIVWSLTDAQ